MAGIGQKLTAVRERISRAAAACGRAAGDVTLVAVTKTVPAGTVLEGIAAGIGAIGENRVQEALGKYPAIGARAEWHLIGHLQSNKARKAVELFSLIHSVDSVGLAREIGRRAAEAHKVQDILLEVNTSGEPQKYGFAPGAAGVLGALDELRDVKGIKVLGLMTVGPLTEDAARVRGSFRTLKELFDLVRSESIPGIEMKHLSMGMSGDFEDAIAEGSTMVRIGSAIFGSRT